MKLTFAIFLNKFSQIQFILVMKASYFISKDFQQL